MTSIYSALGTYLRQRPDDRCSISIADIEHMIGRSLPNSARPPHPTWHQWWENSGSTKSKHSQSKFGWLAVGWETERESFDWERDIVVFRREAVRGYWNTL